MEGVRVCFFSLVLMCVFASDTFSSIAELEKLYEIEQEISSKLELYLQSTRSQMRAIEKYTIFNCPYVVVVFLSDLYGSSAPLVTLMTVFFSQVPKRNQRNSQFFLQQGEYHY